MTFNNIFKILIKMEKSNLLKSILLLFVLTMGVATVGADTKVKWVKTAPADLQAGDVVAIVDSTSSTAIANDPKEGKAPSGKSVTLNENKDQIDTSSSELAANLQWTVAIPEEGKFQFKKDDTNYLFAKPNNSETDSLLVGVPGDGEVKDFQLVKDEANNQADFLFAKMSDEKGYYIGMVNRYISKSWSVRPSIDKDISSTVVVFFKKIESDKKDVKITFEQENYEFDLDGNETFVSPIATTDPEGKTLTYSSNNEFVAEVNAETGEVKIKYRGIATITASFAGDEEYDATSASYTLRVDESDGVGGMNNPISASDAYTAVVNGNLATGSVYFVKGIVSKITGNSEDILGAISSFIDIPGVTSDGGVTYYISDNGSSAEGVKQIEVTAGRGLENGELKAQRNLCVGDEVIVVGQMSYASSTPGMSIGGSGGGTGGDNKDSEKTPKIDKGNYMYQYTPRIIAADTLLRNSSSHKITDLSKPNETCETKMMPGEPTVELSNDNLTLSSDKLFATKEGVDTVTINCPFKVNESDAEAVFTTVRKFYVTVTSINEEPAGKLPGYLELVTDASTLSEKDSILIVATKDDKSYALSSTGALMGGMSGKEVTIEENGTIKSVPDGATPVKLQAIGDKWALRTADKNYFYTSLNSSAGGFDLSSLIGEAENKLRHGEIAGEVGDSAQVTIAIDAEGLATITMRGDSIMRYAETSIGTGESGGSGGTSGGSGTSMAAFNCYASTASDGVLVKIYRFREGPSFDITVGANGWLPLVSAKDVTLPEDLKAYIVKDVADGKVKLEEVTTLKAETPYILKGEDKATYTLTVTTEAKAPENNKLQISTKSTTDGVYVLDTKSAEDQFNKWNDGLLGTGHVYLPAEVGGEALTLTINYLGEVNGDGEVDAKDIVDILNYMMGNPTSTEKFNEKAADANKDGTINAADIVWIVNKITSAN